MKKLPTFAMAALLVCAAGSATGFAQDLSAGKSGTVADDAKDAGDPSSLKAAKSVGGITADRNATRDVVTDPAAAAKAFTFVGRSRDGKDVRVEPSENVVKALMGEKTNTGDHAFKEGEGADPETGDDASRSVVGADDRVQVYNTKRFPFAAIGYLGMVDANQNVFRCTATLIGPRTIITAAHCLYNHAEKQPWRDGFTFWTGLAGEQSVPFPAVGYETAYVAQGFIDNWGGNYDTVWAYDIGIVTLAEPIGEQVGWMGYWDYPNMGNFTANIVGYPTDKDPYTMWRSTCDVKKQDVTEYDVSYACDVTDGMQGAPIYFYDGETKDRFIVGISIGDFGDKNWGLRLYQAIFEWIQTVNK